MEPATDINAGRAFPDALDGTTGKTETEAQEEHAKALEKAVEAACLKIDELTEKRKSLNSEISAIVEDLESQGINRHALRYVLQYRKMDESKRENLDLSYIIARKAVGLPVQADMFDAPIS